MLVTWDLTPAFGCHIFESVLHSGHSGSDWPRELFSLMQRHRADFSLSRGIENYSDLAGVSILSTWEGLQVTGTVEEEVTCLQWRQVMQPLGMQSWIGGCVSLPMQYPKWRYGTNEIEASTLRQIKWKVGRCWLGEGTTLETYKFTNNYKYCVSVPNK